MALFEDKNENQAIEGLGNNKITKIENIAKEKGYKYLVANVSKENVISTNMHIKFGFKKVNKEDNQIKFIKKL